MRRGVLVLPGWAAGPESLLPLVPAGVPAATADWDAARGPEDFVPLALGAAARAGAELAGAELTVVGWSLGAIVALEALPALAARPGRIAALHLVAPCLRFTEGWPERVIARMRRRCAEDPDGVLAAFERAMAAPGETLGAEGGAEPAPSRRRCRPLAAALAAGLDYLAGRALAPPAPPPGCRVRILHGGADTVVPPALSVPLAAALGAERRVLTGAGHAPQLTRAAECAAFFGVEAAAERAVEAGLALGTGQAPEQEDEAHAAR